MQELLIFYSITIVSLLIFTIFLTEIWWEITTIRLGVHIANLKYWKKFWGVLFGITLIYGLVIYYTGIYSMVLT